MKSILAFAVLLVTIELSYCQWNPPRVLQIKHLCPTCADADDALVHSQEVSIQYLRYLRLKTYVRI